VVGTELKFSRRPSTQPNKAIAGDLTAAENKWSELNQGLTAEAKTVRERVLEGITEADSGNVEPWDAEQIKRAGRQSAEGQR